MAKKSKQTTSIDSYTQGLQRDNYQNAMQKFGNAEYKPVSATDISGFMSPYQQDVIDTSLATLGDQENMALNAQKDAAIRARAFGGTGRDVAEALTRGEYAKTRASTVSGLNNQNYAQALQTAIGQNSAANQYPLLIQQLLNGTLQGVTPTTTGTTTQSDPMGTIGGITKAAASAAQIAAMFSDVRLKRDIETVGYDEAGRRIVDYRYLWSDTVYRGHIAQELLKTDPQAVFEDESGFLKVHYGMLS